MTDVEYLKALVACKTGGLPEFRKLLAMRRERVKEKAVAASTTPEAREQCAGAAHELQDLINDLERNIPTGG